jgi:Ca-activated chloride channel homolog
MLPAIILNAQSEKKEIRKGNKEYEKGSYGEADLHYRKAWEKKPDSDKANYNLGNALYKQSQFEPAITKYETLIARESDKNKLATYYYNLGDAYFKAQNLEKSIEAYKQSLRLNPTDDDAKHNLFLAQQLRKQEQQQKNDNDQNKEASDFAKKLKKQAEELVAAREYQDAYNLMIDGEKKDQTVKLFRDFTNRISDVIKINQ